MNTSIYEYLLAKYTLQLMYGDRVLYCLKKFNDCINQNQSQTLQVHSRHQTELIDAGKVLLNIVLAIIKYNYIINQEQQ
jgi:hypothetical protein